MTHFAATYFVDYLNIGEVQNAIGVSTNYTDANNDIYWLVFSKARPLTPLMTLIVGIFKALEILYTQT